MKITFLKFLYVIWNSCYKNIFKIRNDTYIFQIKKKFKNLQKIEKFIWVLKNHKIMRNKRIEHLIIYESILFWEFDDKTFRH